MDVHDLDNARRRVRRSFLLLAIATILAFGSLSTAVTASPSPAAGILTAASALVAVCGVGLMGRIVVVTGRRRPQQDVDRGGRGV